MTTEVQLVNKMTEMMDKPVTKQPFKAEELLSQHHFAAHSTIAQRDIHHSGRGRDVNSPPTVASIDQNTMQ